MIICIYGSQNDLMPRLVEVPEKGTDLDSRILDAYINQCTAEAQEGLFLHIVN